jgi:hypothetical protein
MTPIDRQRSLRRVLALAEARQIIRDRLHAKNMKPSRIAAAEISRMAQQYLNEGHWPELEAQALGRIMASPSLRLQYEAAGRKYAAAMARR